MGQARERERGELREEKMGRRGKERKEKREREEGEEGRRKYDKLGKKWMIPKSFFSHPHGACSIKHVTTQKIVDII